MLVNCWDYTEMHGQQNINKRPEGDNIKQTAYVTDIPVIHCYEFYLVL